MAVYDPTLPQFPDRPNAVVHNGVVILYLNEHLIKYKKLPKKNVDTLKKLHCELYDTYLKMEATNDREELKLLAAGVEQIEFAQQKAWKFNQDSTRHLWFDVPKCSCPKLDNVDQLGSGDRIINRSCLVHGDLK